MYNKDKLIEKLKEIEAWLCFNTHPSMKQIDDFRLNLKSEIASLESELAKEQDVSRDQYGYPLTIANNHVEIKEQKPRIVTHCNNPITNEDTCNVLAKKKTCIRCKYVSIDSDIKEQEPEGITADGILTKTVPRIKDHPNYDFILLAMEIYAKSKQINLREELNKAFEAGRDFQYFLEDTNEKPDFEMWYNEYLQSKEKLGDELCKYCPLEKKGVYGVDGGCMAGCEGSRCNDAYDNYKAEQKPEGVTTEEVLSKYKSHSFIADTKPITNVMVYYRSVVLDAMESYAKSKQINLKEELIKFMIWYNRHFDMGNIEDASKKIVDEYLQSKEK